MEINNDRSRHDPAGGAGHSSAEEEWEDLFAHEAAAAAREEEGTPATHLSPSPDRATVVDSSAHCDRTEKATAMAGPSRAARDVATTLQSAIIQPLCICANQKHNRIAVGHAHGFLVFHVEQDRSETFEELLPLSSPSPSAPAGSSERARAANDGSGSSTAKASLSHLTLDPFYNTDVQTFSAIKRRMRTHESRLQQRAAADVVKASPVVSCPLPSKDSPLLVGHPDEHSARHADPVSPPQAASGAYAVLGALPPPSAGPSVSLRAYSGEVSDVMVSDDSMVSRAHRAREKKEVWERRRRELGRGHDGSTAAASTEPLPPESSTPFLFPFSMSEVNRPSAHPVAPFDVTAEEAAHAQGQQQQHEHVFYESSEEEDGDDEGVAANDLWLSRVNESHLNLFLSCAQGGGPSRRGLLSSAAQGSQRSHQRTQRPLEHVEESGTSQHYEDEGVADTAQASEALPEIAWDDTDDSDGFGYDEPMGHGEDNPPENSSSTDPTVGGAGSGPGGLVSASFLQGKAPIGFYGGGVAAIALQYEQSQVALVGGGPTPMRRGPQPARAVPCGHAAEAVGSEGKVLDGCDVFLLCSGCCRQVLTLADPVVAVMLDARLLFTLTHRELRVYADPMDRSATRCGFALSLLGNASLPASPLAGPAYAEDGSALSVYDNRSTTDTRTLTKASWAPSPTPLPSTTPPCVVLDYTRSLLLVRGTESDRGFALFRYITSLEKDVVAEEGDAEQAAPPQPSPLPAAAAPSVLPLLTGRTAVHVRCLASLPEAHKNALAALALHVGPAMAESTSDDAAASQTADAEMVKEFGRESVNVAAASAYATRITLWKLTGRQGSAAANEQSCLSLAFVPLREFRVGLRMPSAASHFLRWGSGRRSGGDEGPTGNSRDRQVKRSPPREPESVAVDMPSDKSFSGSATTASPSSLRLPNVSRADPHSQPSGDAPLDAQVFHLQFLHRGQFLFCVRGKTMLVFSCSEASARDAKNVCLDHPKATRNQASRLAAVNHLVHGLLDASFLSPYTRQAWASCKGKLPVHDGIFYPKWLLAAAASQQNPRQQQASQFLPSPASTAAPASSSSQVLKAGATAASTVTSWLSSKLFKGASGAAVLPTVASTTNEAQQQPQASPAPAVSENVTRQHLPTLPLAKCLLIWEHDTPTSVTTHNYQRFGPANVPADFAHRSGHISLPYPPSTTAAAMEWERGARQDDAFVSVGPGGKRVARKIVLDCATCDGSFVNIRLYTDSAQLRCSPAVPFQLK